MSAALFLRGPCKCLSRQLKLALSLPPRNHLANGSFQSSTLCHFVNQVSDCACSAQKLSGASCARCQSCSYSARLLTCARAANSGEGENFRISFRTLVILAAPVDIVGSPEDIALIVI